MARYGGCRHPGEGGHDWPDRDALRILGRAREAMPTEGTLYVIEMVLNLETGRGGLLDLNMLVMTQGAERTEKQFRDILREAGFGLIDLIETKSISSVLIARALLTVSFAASWIIEQLSRIPAQADVAVISRHAEREDIPPGTFGVDVPLTACGVSSAERFGAILSATRPQIRATASPVPRCESTAKAILRGGGWPEEVALDWRLGGPGPFVVDEEISGALFLLIGILEIVRHQLTRTEPPAGMRATSEGVDLLLGLAANDLRSRGHLNIYVTHDAILAVLVAHLYRLPVDGGNVHIGPSRVAQLEVEEQVTGRLAADRYPEFPLDSQPRIPGYDCFDRSLVEHGSGSRARSPRLF